MESLSVAYQEERGDLEAYDPTRVCILALFGMISGHGEGLLEFETSALNQGMNRLAIEQELKSEGETFTNPRRVGRLLKRLRFRKAPPGKTRRRWQVTAGELEALARSYGMAPPSLQNADNADNAETPMEESAFLQDRHFRHYISDSPGQTGTTGNTGMSPESDNNDLGSKSAPPRPDQWERI